MSSPPRVEIAPGIFAESVVRRAGRGLSQVYRVSGGVFDGLELESMRSLAQLVGILSSFDSDELRRWADEPDSTDDELAAHRARGTRRRGARSMLDAGHRRCGLDLPEEVPPAAAHRRFACDTDSARRARIWAAETLGDCLPDTGWSVAVLEQTALQVGALVAEAVQSGAAAVLVTLEIDGRHLYLTRFDELAGGAEPAAAT